MKPKSLVPYSLILLSCTGSMVALRYYYRHQPKKCIQCRQDSSPVQKQSSTPSATPYQQPSHHLYWGSASRLIVSR